MTANKGAISVEIHGRIYQIRGEEDAPYIQNLAKIVHDKMVEVEEATHTVDSFRVAVLAALNLADESCKTKARLEARLKQFEKERDHLRQIIDQALRGDDSVNPA